MWISIGTAFLDDAGIKREPIALDQSLWLLELEDIEKDTGRIVSKVRCAARASRSTKSEFQPDDILCGKLRPYLNKVLVADELGYSTTEIVAIRPYVPLCSEYCALALRRPDFVQYVTTLGQGTKMPRLRTKDAIAAPFPLPPLAEQRRIVSKVDQLMALCDGLEEARTEREETRHRLTKASYSRLSTPDTDDKTFRAHAGFAIDAFPALTARADPFNAPYLYRKSYSNFLLPSASRTCTAQFSLSSPCQTFFAPGSGCRLVGCAPTRRPRSMTTAWMSGACPAGAL